ARPRNAHGRGGAPGLTPGHPQPPRGGFAKRHGPPLLRAHGPTGFAVRRPRTEKGAALYQHARPRASTIAVPPACVGCGFAAVAEFGKRWQGCQEGCQKVVMKIVKVSRDCKGLPY